MSNSASRIDFMSLRFPQKLRKTCRVAAARHAAQVRSLPSKWTFPVKRAAPPARARRDHFRRAPARLFVVRIWRRSNCAGAAFVIEPGEVGQKLQAAEACSKIA
jgi:hypothetical protein